MSGAKVPRTAAQLREDFLCSLDNDGDCEATLLDRLIAAVRAEARRQLGEADEKLLAIAGIVNGYHNDTAEAASWDCLRAIATVLGPPWADAEDGGAFVAGEAK